MITSIVITEIANENEYNQAVQILKDNGGAWSGGGHDFAKLSKEGLVVDGGGKFWNTLSSWEDYAYLTFQEFLEKYGKKEVQPKFKVGDRVNESINTPEMVNNGFKKTMNAIIKTIKNLSLTADEKLLRKFGFKDECGNYTQDARDIVIEKLVADNNQYLIDTATALQAEEDKK